MTGSTYPLLVSLLPHTQPLHQAHAKLLSLVSQDGGLSVAEIAEHEQMLRKVRAVVEAQHRWLADADELPEREA